MKLAIAGVVLLILVAAGILYARISSVPDYGPGRLGSFVSWDSGLYPGPVPPGLQWMDNDTIVYTGSFSPKPSPSVASRLTDSIIIWHLGDAPVALTDERWSELRFNACAADGRIVHPVEVETKPDGKRTMRIEEGTPGHFQERLIDYQPGAGPFGSGDSRPCDYYTDPKMAGHLWITDHDRKFYLDFGLNGKWPPSDDPVMLLSSSADRPAIALPVTRHEAIYTCAQYHSFTHLFYVEGCGEWGRNADRNGDSRCYWTIDPDSAQTEQHCIPFDRSLGKGWDRLLPTKRGVFFSTSRNMSLRDVGLSGLFQFDGKSTSLVIPGFVENASVSPDGCRIAFSYAKTFQDIVIGTPGEYSVVAIDVCKGK